MRRAAVLVALTAGLVLAPTASANGDPASDVLLTQQVFVGPEVPLTQHDKDALTKTVAAANERGYPIRVALIAFTGDLGTAYSLWRKPQDYAKFLGSEVAFVYGKRLLVAMPAGFGVRNGKRPVAKEQRVLATIPPGRTPAALAQQTTKAVRALAASAGVQVPDYTKGGGGNDWRDRIIIAVAGLVVVALIVFAGRGLRARGGGRSPSAGLRSSPPRSPGSSDPGTGGRSETPP
jgi:hypothetical protein